MTTPENTPDDKVPETGKLSEPAQGQAEGAKQSEKTHETGRAEESAG